MASNVRFAPWSLAPLALGLVALLHCNDKPKPDIVPIRSAQGTGAVQGATSVSPPASSGVSPGVSPGAPPGASPGASLALLLPDAAPLASATAASVPSLGAATTRSDAGAVAPASASASALGSASASASANAVAAKPVGVAVSGPHFALSFSAPGDCKATQRCTATLTLKATEGYHINNEFPYKFVAEEHPNTDFLGKDARTFSKAAGDFAKVNETQANIAVAFAGKASGKARVAGTYKMSICSESNCQVESQAIALEVPIQ